MRNLSEIILTEMEVGANVLVAIPHVDCMAVVTGKKHGYQMGIKDGILRGFYTRIRFKLSDSNFIAIQSENYDNEISFKKAKWTFNSLWLVDAKEFQRMLSQGTFLSYENRLSLGGPCRAGKSTLASVLIDEKIPLRWNSTDGLVIYFGRNGDRGHDVLAKILRGKPDVLNISTPTELDQTKTPVSRNTSKNQNENNISKALIKELQMHHSVTRTSTNELENQTNTSITNSDFYRLKVRKRQGDTAKMKECFLAEIKEMFSSHEKKNHIHLDTLYFINGVDKNDDEIKE
ncbi:unnamed protein product [Mytilus edulis]|uniref:Uncharacterized protein n=1 Tax=Mytilus edulis TaxID=6550 RepID=A0A8S3UPZ2_MYTED|nr:unnamed protein product [Mytilus edulis]